MRDVVITGFGVVSALGAGTGETERALRRAVPSLAPPTLFDPAPFPGLAVGEARSLEATPAAARGGALLHAAAAEAAAQARLSAGARADVVLGTTLGGMDRGTAFMREVLARGAQGADATLLADFLPVCQPLGLRARLGIRGRVTLVNNACSSGTDALGLAWERIRSGAADCVLAGGYDPLCEFVVNGFGSLLNVTRTACRPFDRDRDGLALGEGAAVFVLEAEGEARRRGAEILGRVRGFGAASDAHHMTQPDPGGSAVARAMERALATAGIAPADLGYINLHGTATKLNDLSECRGVARVFGAPASAPPCGSTKGLTGHTLGAAGAVEAAFCLIALNGAFLPPNAGWQTPDPEMEGLPLVRATREEAFRFALSDSLGFGGGASAVVLEGRPRA